MAVWMVWIYTTWVLNQLDPEKTSVRVLLFSLMLAGLFMSMTLPDAFGDRGLIFALAYAAMPFGRTLFVFVMAGGNLPLRANCRRILIWFAGSSVFWIAGGLAEPGLRLLLWAIALGMDLVGPAPGFAVPGLGHARTTPWEVKGGHMAERCGLFVIICPGESLLVSGATFAQMVWTTAGMLAFLSAVLGAIAMWWVYFHIGHKRGAHHIGHSDDPGRMARIVYSYMHIPIVAGVVLVAVGSERAIVHPGDVGTWAESASAIGGLALFLVGNGLFKRASSRNFPLSHWIGLALCGVAAAVGSWTTLLALNLAGSAILVLVAVWEHKSFAAGPQVSTS